MRVAVCIITYGRPGGLGRALAALGAQTFPDDSVELRVVVVDNDAAGSARAVCDVARAELPWPLDYDVEPRRGIPIARNRCVARARAHSDWIAFVDDDEEPAPGWLAELCRACAEHGADVATGPVVPRFSGPAPGWAVRGGFFQRRRFPTGTLRDRAFTNNVLFRATIFDTVQPHFDERMVMTGGSDTHFSRRVHRAGYRIVWADRAEVYETFPSSRVTVRWIGQRAYRTGTTTAFIARDLDSLPRAAVQLVPDAIFRLLTAAILVPAGVVLGRHRTILGVRHFCCATGMLVGLFGGRYEEYRTIHAG